MRLNQKKLRNDPEYVWNLLKKMFGIESNDEGDDRAIEVLTKAMKI
jgi:hypothetical protein